MIGDCHYFRGHKFYRRIGGVCIFTAIMRVRKEKDCGACQNDGCRSMRSIFVQGK